MSFVFVLLIFLSALSAQLIRPNAPGRHVNHHAADTALIIVSGYKNLNSQYFDIAKSIQLAFPSRLWVFIADYTQDLERVRQNLFDQGLEPESQIYLLGHSFKGSAAVQDYAFHSSAGLAGIITVGSAMLSDYRYLKDKIPFMSINGDMDGLFKPLRSGEAYYHCIKSAINPTQALNTHPVILLQGHNHNSILHDPENIRMTFTTRDLRQSIPKEQAHEEITRLTVAFMGQHGVFDSMRFSETIKQYALQSQRTLEPLASILELEANPRIKKPCDSDYPSPHCPYYPMYPMVRDRTLSNDTTCQCGNPWTVEANKVLAAGISSQISVITIDAIHPLETMNPIHHPHIWNDCLGQSECVLNMTTVTENVYDHFDERLDTQGSYISARQIGVKLKSRQSIIQVTLDKYIGNVDVSETDPDSVCREMNEHALDVALNHLPQSRIDLFHQFGEKIVFEQDSQIFMIEPLWVMKNLKMERAQWQNETVLMIGSPSFRLSVNMQWHNITMMAGLHYCKLVSPARLLEWMYTDSLRSKLGLPAGSM